jgi:hypothetical protein
MNPLGVILWVLIIYHAREEPGWYGEPHSGRRGITPLFNSREFLFMFIDITILNEKSIEVAGAPPPYLVFRILVR